MMEFRKIRDALRRLLIQNAGSEFNVITAQKRGKSAEEVVDNSRLVEVYYNRGGLPKSGGGLLGPKKHDMTFRIDLTVAKATEGDTAVIEDPGSSAAEVSRAIADMKSSMVLADESIDELFDCVYQILMDARNVDFGLPDGTIGSRWVTDLAKDEPTELGNLTMITGSLVLTCTATEPVDGYEGVTVKDPVMDSTLEIETDLPGKAGVQVGA